MDDWFAFIGSRLPGRGAEACLLERRFWFLQLFLKGVEDLIERRGVALIPGHARARHAFITVDNVADFMVKAVGHPATRNATLEIGGPEILTWGEVAATYADVLGRKVRPVYAPGGVFRMASRLTAPFSEAVSDVLGLNWLVAYDSAHDARRLAEALGVTLTSADRFLREKAALPAA
jgi:NADH dehydrogenase